MIRKGLALGLGTALLSTAIVASPASAAVDDTAISLVPFTGTQYSMVTDGHFDLKSTQSTSAASSSGKISYKVTDTASISKFDYAADLAANTDAEVLPGAVSFALGDATDMTVAYVASTDVVTLDDPDAGDEFAGIDAGDIIYVNGLNSTKITTALTGWFEVVSNTADDTITFKAPGLATTGSTDITTETLSAGTITEVSDNVELDSYDIISAGALGGGVTTLAAPTRAADGSYVIVGPNADSTKTDLLRLVASKAGTVTVQAWIDENADGLIDSTEATSSARTVTFVTWANSGAAVVIDTPVAGATWDVELQFNSTINASQLVSDRLDLALGVLEDGVLETAVASTSVAAGAFTAATQAWTYGAAGYANKWTVQVAPATDLELVGTDSDTETVFVAGYSYAGQLFLDGAAYGNIVYTNLGAAVADTVGGVVATRGANVTQPSSTSVEVREEYTGSVEFKVLLTEDDATVAGNPTGAGAGKVAVAAGTEVTVKVALGGASLDADSTVTSGGLTLTSTSTKAISYTAVTDANGYVTFSLSNDEGEAGDDLDVTVTHAGTAVTSSVIWVAATANDSVLAAATVVSIEAKDAWSIEYTAVDEFGAALTGPTYRVVATYYSAVGGTQKTAGVALDANGKGSLSVTDASLATGNFSVVGTLQKLGTDAVYADYGNPETVTSVVYVVTDKTPAAITIVEAIDSDGGDPKVETLAAANVDATGPNGPAAPAVDTDEEYTISGVVTTASGAAVRGTTVTLSGSGLMFKSGNRYTAGSITVTTSNTGAYSVEVRSNLAGERVLTATAGAATKTKSIGFDAALATTGASLVVDAPASIAAGSSFTVKVSLVDAFGNPVAADATRFGLTYSGAGIALSVPTVTNALGQASFAVLLGSNDTGAGTITATYDADATASTVDNNYSVVKTVNGAASSDTKVNAGSFKGYVALYAKGYAGKRMSAKVGNDWVVVPVLASDFERVVEFTGAGYTVAVRIYIDRVLIDTITVTTK